MRKRLMPAKSSFLEEGNGVKDSFLSSQLSGYFCGSSYPPPPRNPVIKPSFILLILCKIFFIREKMLDITCL